MNRIVIDCEATQLNPAKQCDAKSALVYDVGWVVENTTTGDILAKRSYVVSDIFYGRTDLMATAYYSDKVPTYNEGIQSGEWSVKSFHEIWDQFRRDCKNFDVSKVWAYNCSYDYHALNHTVKVLSNGFCNYFIPYGVETCDIWQAATIVTGTKKYVRWCYERGYLTDSGNPQTNAEVVYRYISDETDFSEDHTALSDAFIELKILKRIDKRKQKKSKKWGNGWQKASKVAESMGLK